jgi:hypothetical protein
MEACKMKGGAVNRPSPTRNDEVLIALLARLGVDERHEGQGLGDAIGCRGLLVHAESEQARSFYEHLIPEFERSPTDPLHLLLLLKDIRRTLGSLPR